MLIHRKYCTILHTYYWTTTKLNVISYWREECSIGKMGSSLLLNCSMPWLCHLSIMSLRHSLCWIMALMKNITTGVWYTDLWLCGAGHWVTMASNKGIHQLARWGTFVWVPVPAHLHYVVSVKQIENKYKLYWW